MKSEKGLGHSEIKEKRGENALEMQEVMDDAVTESERKILR